MDARTRLCCLIGNPVGHSLSPMIHNTLAKEMGINLVYTAFKVEDGRVGDAIKGADAFDVLGMNVTVPHKCRVIEELKSIDPLAEKIGAVNTLVRTDGGYKGYNTDIIGLWRELVEEEVEITGREIIILGAGGASKAITYLCASKGAYRIYLLNRSIEKAEMLADEVNSYFGDVVCPLTLDEYVKIPHDKKYPIIQTTSVGLHPDDDNAPVLDGEFYKLAEVGVDIIFNPSETKFMKLCKAAGARACNGLKMLLYQGIAAFELWNNVKVPEELADKILKMMEKELA